MPLIVIYFDIGKMDEGYSGRDKLNEELEVKI